MPGDIKFPLVDIRQNLEGNWEVVEITQNITVPSSGEYVARLNELPDNGDISGNLPSIDGLTLANTYSPESGQFGVKYSTGDVIFNSAQSGQTFSITYYGKGTLIEAADINYLYDVSLPIGASGGQFARWDETTERWILIFKNDIKWRKN